MPTSGTTAAANGTTVGLSHSSEQTPTALTTVIACPAGQIRLWVHPPPADVPVRLAVVMCSPFGSQDLGAWRFRRWWASRLAGAGYPTVRFDLPATGDSEGLATPDSLLDRWLLAITDVERWTRRATAAPATAALGIGLGGLLAAESAFRGARYDTLVLWGVPAHGRAMLREMRAVATLGDPAITVDGAVVETVRPDGGLELTGFALSPATVDAITAIDLSASAAAAASPIPRALVLGRDALAPDEALIVALEAHGTEVTVADGEGYAESQIAPEYSRPAVAVANRTVGWLRDVAERPASHTVGSLLSDGGSTLPATMTLSVAGSTVVETPIVIDSPSGGLFGLLSEPGVLTDGDLCVVMIGAGAQRHIGPNRNWVEFGRRWAAGGIRSIRADLASIGESDGHPTGPLELAAFYDERRIDETLAILAELRGRGLGKRFVLLGLCAGAYWSLHAAIRDQSVVGVGAINPEAWAWSAALVRERGRRQLVQSVGSRLRERIDQRTPLRELAPRGVRALREELVRTVTGGVEQAQTAQIVADLDALRDRGTDVVLLLAEAEPFYQQLTAQGLLDRLPRWPNVRVDVFAKQDHSARALSSQRRVAHAVDQLVQGAATRVKLPDGAESGGGSAHR